MFEFMIARWTRSNPMAPREVAIPLDRPDLMADAGYDGSRYTGDKSPASGGGHRASWWMPFHATAG